jgi:hypothetical protein
MLGLDYFILTVADPLAPIPTAMIVTDGCHGGSSRDMHGNLATNFMFLLERVKHTMAGFSFMQNTAWWI